MYETIKTYLESIHARCDRIAALVKFMDIHSAGPQHMAEQDFPIGDYRHAVIQRDQLVNEFCSKLGFPWEDKKYPIFIASLYSLFRHDIGSGSLLDVQTIHANIHKYVEKHKDVYEQTPLESYITRSITHCFTLRSPAYPKDWVDAMSVYCGYLNAEGMTFRCIHELSAELRFKRSLIESGRLWKSGYSEQFNQFVDLVLNSNALTLPLLVCHLHGTGVVSQNELIGRLYDFCGQPPAEKNDLWMRLVRVVLDIINPLLRLDPVRLENVISPYLKSLERTEDAQVSNTLDDESIKRLRN